MIIFEFQSDNKKVVRYKCGVRVWDGAKHQQSKQSHDIRGDYQGNQHR